MTFFNKKTEVMNIEMTPYGRYLYSIGKFKPKYYEFVDDDILYRASGSSENQNGIHQRIVQDTPKLKNVPMIKRIEESTDSINIDSQRKIVHEIDQNQFGLYPMGRSSYSSDKYPNFQVSVMRGEISSSQTTQDVSGCVVFVPQIDIDCNFNISLVTDSSFSGADVSTILTDGSILQMDFEDIMINIKEYSSLYEKNNYDIEVFEIMPGETLRSLKFFETQKEYSGVGLSKDLKSNISFEEIDANYVEYYFDIITSEETLKSDICRLGGLEINNHLLDKDFECEDQRTDRFNIYSTNVSPDDLEDC